MRRAVQKTRRRSSRRTSRFRPRRTSRVGARRGSLRHGSLRAREYRGSNPLFKGRIEVVRGSGLVEYPAPHQFGRIAREEGVPAEDVRRAFGHMRGLKKNAKPKRIVRRGLLFLEGDDEAFEAWEVDTPPELLVRMGSPKSVAVDVGGVGLFQIMKPEQALRRARQFGFRTDAFKTAFGHLMTSPMTSVRGPGSRLPTIYGPRPMKLGHYEEGQAKGGIRKGSLLLFHRPSGMIVWSAMENTDARTKGHKPVVVKFGAKSKAMTIGKALNAALDRNIPPLAFLDAFGYLINRTDLRQLYAKYS